MRISTLSLLGRLALLCVGIRIGLEAIGLSSLAFHGQPAWSNAIHMWRQWDANSYLRLAEVGYVHSPASPNTGEPTYIAFFPGFPLAVRIVSFVVPDSVVSALIVCFAASLGVGYFLFRLVALEADEATAWRAVLLLFSFPTAYFLAAPFSEAVFLFAVLASVHAARTGAWAGAGLAGALATGTRLTGIALAPAFLIEAFARGAWARTPARELVRRLAWIYFSGVGLLAYLMINQILYGDPLWFVRAQRTNWGNQAAPPWQTVMDGINGLIAQGGDTTWALIYGGRTAGVLVALPLLVLAVRRLRLPDVLYAWVSFIIVLTSSWLISLPRYLLVLYPLFVVGSLLSRRRSVFVPLVLTSAALQGWLMWRYSVGEWTF